jgi:hypothetical protein
MNTIPGRYLSPLYAYNARGRCILLQNSLPLKRNHPQQQQKEKGFLMAHASDSEMESSFCMVWFKENVSFVYI